MRRLPLSSNPQFEWGSDRPPRTPWQDTVIYELHVKGFSQLHPDIPAPLRGTYLGLASEPAIAHLKALGVTAVELMPVHQHADEWTLARRGLTNYWGYNTLSYFAPALRFAPRGTPIDAVREFKIMVQALHEAGIEVLLDVVYNHTAENDHLGPSLSMRGIDNANYYRLRPGDRSRYEDFTGTGNTLNMQSPHVLKLVMDSLRYWVLEMHVDGFRFDLASALARELYSVDRLSAFFDVIAQDPVISQVKLIAEPWDVGEGGYQVGQFPPGWTEWNGRYRDAVRRFWRGDPGLTAELATRLAGSSDLYGLSGRSPHASVNFVTSHDGFTLADLTAYNDKHNEANGENNRDGESQNFSSNAGVEGPTDEAATLELRRRQQRNFALTLAISQGVPMLSGGDEVSRTQRGNNNAYCQDSELTWTPWDISPEQQAFLTFVRRVLALRRDQPALRRRTFLGRGHSSAPDVRWLRADGHDLTEADWHDASRRSIGVLLDGNAIGETTDRSEAIVGDSLFVLLNAGADPVTFKLPPTGADSWVRVLDTADPDSPRSAMTADAPWIVTGRSAVVFTCSSRR